MTEERASERALLELTDSLTTTLNSIAEGVIATDESATITRLNPVAERLTGWPANAALGRPLHDVLDIVGEGGVTVTPVVESAVRDGSEVALESDAELVRRDGTRLGIAGTCAPLRRADGSIGGAVVVFRDLTAERQAREEHERLRRQLIFADRMASVGTLAAGVAHEINNPLAYVMANLEIIIEERGPVRAGGDAALEPYSIGGTG